MKRRTRSSQMHDYLPSVGHVKKIDYLPRDVRLSSSRTKGELMEGWCETTVTRQLWQCVSETDAKFLGYVVTDPPEV